jgi:hypothetical protein
LGKSRTSDGDKCRTHKARDEPYGRSSGKTVAQSCFMGTTTQPAAGAASAEYAPEMFPEGSTQKPTAALPAVWEKPDQFQQAAERTHGLAEKLAQTAQGGDVQATLAAFAALGKEGCGGCHQTLEGELRPSGDMTLYFFARIVHHTPVETRRKDALSDDTR